MPSLENIDNDNTEENASNAFDKAPPTAFPHLNVANFGAGPAKLPESVISQLQKDLVEWSTSKVGIMEVSHRSPEFTALAKEAEMRLRRLLHIPDDYAVLFMQGGGTLQFSATVYNLLNHTPMQSTARPGTQGEQAGAVVSLDYLVSGSWSRKAYEEAIKLTANLKQVQVNNVPIFSERDPITGDVVFIPPHDWKLSKNSSFVYYCDNETIDGIEMPASDYIPDLLASLGCNSPIVADMSSNFLSRPIDISRFGLIFAAAQKNFGPAGLAVVIVRRDLITRSKAIPHSQMLLPIPTIMDYSVFDISDSLYNTPPTIILHTCDLVFRWMENTFESDLKKVARFNKAKATLICDIIDRSRGVYAAVAPFEFRSTMNICFRITDRRTRAISDILEKQFLKEADSAGLLQLKGHRSVGGIRVSLYNAVTLEETKMVASFMTSFLQSISKH